MTLRDMRTAELEAEEDAANAMNGGGEVDNVEEGVEEDQHAGFQVLRDAAFRRRDFEWVLGKFKQMENKGMCHLIHSALVEHVWQHCDKNSA